MKKQGWKSGETPWRPNRLDQRLKIELLSQNKHAGKAQMLFYSFSLIFQ